MNSINNPVIPCVASLPGGRMQPGNFIIIHGEPLPNCNRFNVNLLCGSRPDSANIALQLSSRFDTSWLIRNSKQSQEWGEEEGLAPRKFPFLPQVPFTVSIYTSPDAFLIAIDGQHYCEYIHRQPYNLVDTLQIQGDVRISLIDFQFSQIYPPQPSVNRLNVVNPPLPFVSSINGSLNVGGELQVHGRVKANPNRFHVNLQQGCQTYPHPNIAFHFNPRFEGGERVIVMNSWFAKWGAEQRISGRTNPFVPNGHFVLIIRRQASFYEVLVSGRRIGTFNHRMIADVVNAVAIDGDVIIDKVLVL